MVDISLPRGQRAFITGTAGSGKTTLALKLCEAMPSPLVILDTKYDPDIGIWAKKNKIRIWNKKEMPSWTAIKSDMVVRPRANWIAFPKALDWWLGDAFRCRYVPSIYIDEIYSIGATANKFGPGIAGLWTRSRAFGMRVLGGAQRPAWISKFVLSESNALYVGMLHIPADRRAIMDATGFADALEKQPQHHFLFIRQTGDLPVRLKPLDLSQSSLYDPQNRYASLTRMRGLK